MHLNPILTVYSTAPALGFVAVDRAWRGPQCLALGPASALWPLPQASAQEPRDGHPGPRAAPILLIVHLICSEIQKLSAPHSASRRLSYGEARLTIYLGQTEGQARPPTRRWSSHRVCPSRCSWLTHNLSLSVLSRFPASGTTRTERVP